MSISTPLDLIQAKRTACGVHILHIDKIVKQNGPKKLTASILTHPYSNQKEAESDDENEVEEGEGDVNADIKDMLLAPIIARRQTATKDFELQDIYPNKDQRESLLHQAAIIAVQSLTEFVKGFKQPKYADEPKFQFPKKRPLPEGYRTRSVTVLSTLGEQISAARLVSIIRETYTSKLHLNEDELTKRAIPCVNDVSINNLLRRALMNRTTSEKDRKLLSTLQLGPGLSDILRKLVSQVIKVHCPKGVESTHGLAPLLKVVGKEHLALGKPGDHDAAVSALDTLVQASLLDCWRVNCGFDDLEAYAASNPKPDDMLALAKKIVIKHAKRLVPKQPDRFEDDSKYSDGPVSDKEGTEAEDQVYTLHRLMLRDMMYVTLLKRAIGDADFGRVEDVLGVVGVYLLGAGMENTCFEIMHFLFDLKYVWSEQFGNIMRDSMIVNYFKKDCNAMPTDISLVNLALYSKFFYQSYGWSDKWHVPKTMDEAIALVDKFDQQLAMKDITEKMAQDECCVM